MYTHRIWVIRHRNIIIPFFNFFGFYFKIFESFTWAIELLVNIFTKKPTNKQTSGDFFVTVEQWTMKLCDVIGQKWIQLFCLSFSEQNHQVDVSENDWNAKLCERNNLLKIDEGKYWWKKSRLCGVAGTMFVRAVPSSLNTNEMSNTPMKIACLHHILRFSFMWHDSHEIVLAHLSQSHHTHTHTHGSLCL